LNDALTLVKVETDVTKLTRKIRVKNKTVG